MIASATAETWTWSRILARTFAMLLLVGVAMQVTFYHWNISLGVLFLSYWWVPARGWGVLTLGAIGLHSLAGWWLSRYNALPGAFLGSWASWQQYFFGSVAPALAAAGGVMLLKRWGDLPGRKVDTAMLVRLHLAALASGSLEALKDLGYVLDDGRVGDIRHNRIVEMVPLGGPHDGQILGQFALSHLMGAFVGIMLLAPLAMWLSTRREESGNARVVMAAARYLLPMVVVYLSLAGPIEAVQFSETFRLLLLVAIILFALHYGWRGASLAILAASLAIAVQDHLGSSSAPPVLLQAFIAISGAMGLLLGAAVDETKGQRNALQAAARAQGALLEELRASALRNLQIEENERRRLAGELHDEFGQNLAALQTHIKLTEPDLDAIGRRGAVDQLFALTKAMRNNIGRVLEALRPPSLDDLGLYGAIDRGVLRQLAEDAGLLFEVDIEGDARLLAALDDTYRTAAYRLVQEAVSNCVRHARASRCQVRLRVNRRRGSIWLFIAIKDDGIGIESAPRAGHGLRSMADRVTALGGRLHLGGPPGLRVHALIRQG